MQVNASYINPPAALPNATPIASGDGGTGGVPAVAVDGSVIPGVTSPTTPPDSTLTTQQQQQQNLAALIQQLLGTSSNSGYYTPPGRVTPLPVQASSGPTVGGVLLIGGAVAVLYFLLRKKHTAA